MRYAEIDTEFLRNYIHYDPESGEFAWKGENSKRKAGCTTKQGYIRIEIMNVGFLAHRLAWQYVTGSAPKNQIDHIDGNKSNNKFCNLREATNQENQFNVGVKSNNTSGYRGVTFHRGTGKWRAVAAKDRKYYSLGLFFTPEEAAAAYAEFAKKLHGEYYKNE